MPVLTPASSRAATLPVVPNADRRNSVPDATERAAAFAIHMQVMEEGHEAIGREALKFFEDDDEE